MRMQKNKYKTEPKIKVYVNEDVFPNMQGILVLNRVRKKKQQQKQ